MDFNQIIFLQVSAIALIIASIYDYINLNRFSEKSIFKQRTLNKDILATRIMMEIKDENSIFYLNGYMWTMIVIAIMGSFFYFKGSYLFNILPMILFLYFIVQYMLLILKVRKATNIENPTFKEIHKGLDEMKWEIKTTKVKLKEFSKKTKETLGITEDNPKYGEIAFLKYIDLNKEKILRTVKSEEDILFYDTNGARYELFYSDDKPTITKTNISVSPVFSEIHKEFNTVKKMNKSIFEAFVSIFVLHLTLNGVSLF